MTRDLTPSQAAELLGVCRSTVRNLAIEGQLPCRVTAGGHRRFSEADVLAVRARRVSDETPENATRAAVWLAAALAVLSDAQVDLGDGSPLAGPFRAAAAELRRPGEAG